MASSYHFDQDPSGFCFLVQIRTFVFVASKFKYEKKNEKISSSKMTPPCKWPVVDFIECFHSRVQHLCKFIGTKESVCIRKHFNSQRIGLGHQHGRRFIFLGHQYGRRDVTWKHSVMQNAAIVCYKHWERNPREEISNYWTMFNL